MIVTKSSGSSKVSFSHDVVMMLADWDASKAQAAAVDGSVEKLPRCTRTLKLPCIPVLEGGAAWFLAVHGERERG